MGKKQYWAGFQLLSELDDNGLVYIPVGNGQLITEMGVCIYTSGYCYPATTLKSTISIIGVAKVGSTAAAASSAGLFTVPTIPLLRKYRWMVPVEANALITRAAAGTLVNLQSVNTIDIGDAVTFGLGFMIEDIDVSAAAIVANTYGYAIGHFEYVAAS